MSRYLLLLIGVLVFSPASLAIETISLPEMGDPSSAEITPDDERRLGESLLRWLRQNDLVETDPLTQSYIHSLGYQLVANSDETNQPYTFFVVKDASINAFAAPGGFIGVHTGLMLTSETESELAGVIAHEIAHITQKHMTRTYDSAKKHQLTTAVALLAAILVGQNVEQLTEAAIATSVAANAQLQINFTRAHEKEADYLGIRTLANAGFDPEGMASFFERMQKASKLYGTAPPEFLSTHPVTVNRIAEARSRARAMPVKNVRGNQLYPFIKARIKVQNANDIGLFIREQLDSASSYDDPDAYQYMLAIAYLKAGSAQKAEQSITSLVKQDNENILYRIAQAEIQQSLGQTQKARQNFESILALYPYSNAITIHYGQFLLDTRQYQLAYNTLKDYLTNREDDPLILKLLSQAAGEMGKTAEAYLYLAKHDYLNGNTRKAITLLNTASKITNLDYYLSAQIVAKLQEYKQIALMEK